MRAPPRSIAATPDVLPPSVLLSPRRSNPQVLAAILAFEPQSKHPAHQQRIKPKDSERTQSCAWLLLCNVAHGLRRQPWRKPLLHCVRLLYPRRVLLLRGLQLLTVLLVAGAP